MVVMIKPEIDRGTDGAPGMKKVCAWCQLTLIVPADDNRGVTHGICAACLKQVLEQWYSKIGWPRA